MNDAEDDPQIDDDTWEEEDDDGDDDATEAEAADNGAPGHDNGRSKHRGGKRREPEPDWDGEGDDRAQMALDFVTDVIDEMEMDCRVRLRRPKEGDEAEVNIEILGRDAGRIIG